MSSSVLLFKEDSMKNRVELLENYILNYLNTTDGKENS